jgi:FMN phosphatase YigB (HAD superfamily)
MKIKGFGRIKCDKYGEDSLSADTAGDVNYGIDTCWINPSKRRNRDQIMPTYEIQDIRELKNLL